MERWPLVLDLLKSNIGNKDFGKWIKPTKLVAVDDNRFVIETPNSFIKNWLETYYNPSLKQTIEKIYRQPDVSVTYKIADSQVAKSATPRLKAKPTAPGPLDVKRQTKKEVFDPSYTFESFVVGSSNQFAHAACTAVADQPGSHYNPLFIYGGVGLGKTHLLHAIGLNLLRRDPKTRICYMSCERFINDLINSLRLKKMDAFRNRYRDNCDVLLIDDIQFLAGKERSQEEFFHTFNALYETKSQIILTSDKVPKEIPNLEERLRSRFEWGLLCDIQPPELETRMAILKKKAEVHGVDLDDDVVLFIADAIRHNIRELEGSLVRLSAYASLTGKSIDLDFAREVFRDQIKPPRQITIDHIQNTVAKAYNIRPTDLCSGRKFKYIALPRQIAMYFSRKLTNASFPDIGSKFGGKDHSTVVHAVRKIEKQVTEDTSLRNSLESLEKTIRFGTEHSASL